MNQGCSSGLMGREIKEMDEQVQETGWIGME
jgi:hypothetical protein